MRLRRTFAPSRAALVSGALAASSLLGACVESSGLQHRVVDSAMRYAFRPRVTAPFAQAVAHGTDYVLLAGDLHCHVSPPDEGWHAVRDARQTFALARRERLDFVVFTPHVGARFFADPAQREWLRASHTALAREIAAHAPAGLIAVAGFEYTDHTFGHVGVAFADLDAVLAEVSVETAQARPGVFFERWVARGGLLVVNHPLVTPIDAAVSIARADLSWRAWTAPHEVSAARDDEIVTVHRLAHGFEAFNLTATHLRDGVLRRDETRTLVATLARLDAEILAAQRRIAPVGGSDSHSHHLRATTFVLARDRSERGVRDGLAAGRVCVRGAEACSLRVRAPHGAWSPVGSAVATRGDYVEVRALGFDIELLRDGVPVARPASGAVTRVALPAGGRCHLVRARVGRGFSAPVYVNCPFASGASTDARAPG